MSANPWRCFFAIIVNILRITINSGRIRSISLYISCQNYVLFWIIKTQSIQQLQRLSCVWCISSNRKKKLDSNICRWMFMMKEGHLMLFKSISQSPSLNWWPPTSMRCTNAPNEIETTVWSDFFEQSRSKLKRGGSMKQTSCSKGEKFNGQICSTQ